ncbi:MAG: flavohemoglobin expression-modulating QEGLA motif protein [Gammaproteobacteria bacterium]|nr:flavohemoglobin expression-modulating QEGLA motif protein [Gammaproteobacteria bacterium]MCW5582323.1 flavohemoglobin expression-modulating QEGLA motif protein [Gammaproteobacteria bacterium]
MTHTGIVGEYEQVVYELSEKIVAAQKPIRILDALKWDKSVEEYFIKSKYKKLPPIDKEYYRQKNPLSFDPDKKKAEFHDIDKSIRRQLGQYSGVGSIMQRMCYEYCRVIDMLEARGTSRFTEISQELYGSSADAFHVGAPTLKDLATLVTNTLAKIKDKVKTDADVPRYTSADAVAMLSERLGVYFSDRKNIRVELSDGIIADAAAGADRIKIHDGLKFSLREIRTFETHEGWVHLGTTLNGMSQPICTFLSKGPPSSTVTQEGLAIITEIFTFSSYPGRVRRLTNRISAVNMAEEGANFFDVFQFCREQGLDEGDSYQSTIRVFRGSTPEGGPYTKDLSYSKGFILIYNFMRLAVQRGLVKRIPLLFVGKTTLEDLHILSDLLDEGIITPPRYVPPQFTDIAAVSAWMVYSLFLNRLDLKRLALDFKGILQ